jgi:phosphate transport system protein
MRKLFSRQLIEARHEMLSIYEEVDLCLHDAVTAFLTDDKKLANKTKKRTLQIDARCANLEAVCYNLIATQGPVASDFRLLQTIIYIDFNLQRMTDKVRQIARAAKHKVKADIELPSELNDLIEREAGYVYRVVGSSISALVNNDMGTVCSLSETDEPVHEIYEEFFRVYNRMSAPELSDDKSYDDLRRAIMVARYLDRAASISIDAASRLTFLLTGQRLTASDLADTDEDELESMRVPSGEGVIMDPASDAQYVARIPADEVGEDLRQLIENLDNDDDEDDAEE